MNTKELQHYLHEQIPASRLLGIEVKSCSDRRVALFAPLEPNINHKNTVFGGSLSVLAITAAWSLVYMRLLGVRNEIVIQESSMTYLKPAHGDVVAECIYDESKQWDRFHRLFDRRGKARIRVESDIYCDGELVAAFTGSYVALSEI